MRQRVRDHVHERPQPRGYLPRAHHWPHHLRSVSFRRRVEVVMRFLRSSLNQAHGSEQEPCDRYPGQLSSPSNPLTPHHLPPCVMGQSVPVSHEAFSITPRGTCTSSSPDF